MENQVEVMRPDPAPAPRNMLAAVAATPADIVLYAMQNGGSMDQIREFMQLQREWDADQARKAYVADMAEFKKNPPTIVKDKAVGYENKDGTFTGYKHATLGNVTGAIVEGLARHGFSHRWDTEQQAGGIIVVTCILTHKAGHSERTMLSATKDDSGKKNSIQQVASAITYLQRYTLLGATGLATQDQGDDDGQAAGETALADRWMAEATRAKDLAALEDVWNRGSIDIEAHGNDLDYGDFKRAVNARKGMFGVATTGVAGKSSRLSSIVGAGMQTEGAAQ